MYVANAKPVLVQGVHQILRALRHVVPGDTNHYLGNNVPAVVAMLEVVGRQTNAPMNASQDLLVDDLSGRIRCSLRHEEIVHVDTLRLRTKTNAFHAQRH